MGASGDGDTRLAVQPCVSEGASSRLLSYRVVSSPGCKRAGKMSVLFFGSTPALAALATLEWCGTSKETRLSRRMLLHDDLCGSKSNFMSMPFAKYARMTIVSDSAIAEGLFAFARAYNKFHIYRTLFIYGTTCAFENININSLGFIEKRIIIFICIS